MPPAAAPLRRADALAALRALRDVGPIKANDLAPPLRRAVLHYWGSIRHARKLLRLAAPRPPRLRWTRDNLLAEIRALARSGQHMSTNAVMATRRDLVEATRKHFGGWPRAREIAGVPRPPRPVQRQQQEWDDATVIATILDRHRAGEPLAVSKAPKRLVNAANRRFGSWRAAVEAAGLDYDTIVLTRRHDDAELLEWVQRAARKHPTLTVDGFDRLGEHASACRRRWGTVEAIAEAAGVSGWPIRLHHSPLTREEVLEALQQRARARKPVNFTSVRSEPGSARLVHSVLRHFATWDRAIEAAGLPPRRFQRARARRAS